MQNVGFPWSVSINFADFEFFSLLSCIKHTTLHLSFSEVGAQKTLMCGEVDKGSAAIVTDDDG
jgi:hypothetical protein